MRVVQLFGVGCGFSNAPAASRGLVYFVAAPTTRRARELARAGAWSLGPSYPLGVVQVSLRVGGRDLAHWTWCRCRLGDGLGIGHGDTRGVLEAAMWAHWTSDHLATAATATAGQARRRQA